VRPDFAAVAIFAYRRPEHLQRCLDALAANPQASGTELHLFLDGSRGDQDAEPVRQTRLVAASASGFGRVHIHERSINFGLARNIIEGVSELLEINDEVIVLEDDLVVSPHFLEYMNAGLKLYEGVDQVASIHGYVYPVSKPLPRTFFLRGADCWGWATWRRAWSTFETNGEALLARIESGGLARDFDWDGAYPFLRILRHQVRGKNDSWAIRWHASCFLQGMLTLYPGVSLVENHGFDGSGRHSSGVAASWNGRGGDRVPVERILLEENRDARAVLGAYLRSRRRLPHRLLGVWRALTARIHRFTMARR